MQHAPMRWRRTWSDGGDDGQDVFGDVRDDDNGCVKGGRERRR